MRALDYTLEFFATDHRGEPERLERLRLRAVSADDAEQQARAYVRNILVNNRPIDRCQIKNQAGIVIKEIQRSALARQKDPAVGEKTRENAHVSPMATRDKSSGRG